MEPTISPGTGKVPYRSYDNPSSIFDSLTQKVLNGEGFKHGSPIYKDDVVNEKDTVEVDDGYISEHIENAEDNTDDEDMNSLDGSNMMNESVKEGYDGDVELIQPVVDPVEWKMELKRVAPVLRVELEGKSDDWRSHLKQAKVEHKKILSEIDKGSDNFRLLSGVITTTLEHLELKEKIINDQFEYIRKEFSSYRGRNRELEQSCQDTSSSVEKLKSDLTIMTKKLKHIKESVNRKGNSITDTSPLARMKAALQQIKSDIRSYDLQLGILEHILLHKRIRQSKIQTRGHVEQ